MGISNPMLTKKTTIFRIVFCGLCCLVQACAADGDGSSEQDLASVVLKNQTPVIETQVGEAVLVNIIIEFNNPNIELSSDIRLTQSGGSGVDIVLEPELPLAFLNLSQSVSIPFSQSVSSGTPGEASISYTVEIIGTAISATTTTIFNISEGPSTEPVVTPSMVSFGIVGDSNSDEFQFNDNRGNAFNYATFNWMELLIAHRALDFGSVGTRSQPRRRGYANNWALSGATASSLISSGQHTGLAQQIANGSVTHALVYIGTNDFHGTNGTYADIYSERLSGLALQRKLDDFVSDVTTAVTTLSQAGPAGLVLVDVADFDFIPFFQALYPNAALRQRVSEAIGEVNARVASEVASLGGVVVDQTALFESIYTQRDSQGNLMVGGISIDLENFGDDPRFGILLDGHAGTVLNGIMANGLFIEPFNQSYGVGLQPLNSDEVLQSAGLR